MSRKPVDQQQPSECRQAVWDWIREHPTKFMASDILYDIKLASSSINEYLTGLVKAGHLERTGNFRNFDAAKFTLINDTGHDAPRVRRDGSPVTQGRGRQQMWNVLQTYKKEFSPLDLARDASTELHSVAESEAKSYCFALCKARYLSSRAGQRYLMISGMWTGPHPPQIQRTKQIYDPNLRRVVWSRVEGGAE